MNKTQTAIIFGAGPAGLTAAYELIHRTNIKPIIYEASADIGGISQTVNYKGNRIDIGGHRFFSKSDRVMRWWLNIMPLQRTESGGIPSTENRETILNKSGGPDPDKTDKVMLLRNRLSRIYFMRKFFDYPISLKMSTITNLGFIRVIKIAFSYALTRLFPRREEQTLEDFFIDRFGKELYLTFFKDYTEKVWGIPCNRISAEWGAQRVKGLSITKAISQAARNIMGRDASLDQKKTETSLITQFMYPKFGPGQMWEEVARIIKAKGGEVHLRHKVVELSQKNGRIEEVVILQQETGKNIAVRGDYFLSSMPVRDLIAAFGEDVPLNVKEVAEGLVYRDFITVGLLLEKLKIINKVEPATVNNLVPDNWIYIQEREVKLGRLQLFNNWSPYMVRDRNKVWMGLEYFCNEGDELWSKSDAEFSRFAIDELAKIGVIDKADVLDSIVIRMPKTYPAYFGTYDRFDEIISFVDNFESLFLIGRNGMHRYNNTDHSMLTAMVAVDNIIAGVRTKHNIWSINTEDEYHEAK